MEYMECDDNFKMACGHLTRNWFVFTGDGGLDTMAYMGFIDYVFSDWSR